MINGRYTVVALLILLISAALYLLSAWLNAGVVAFPLDDAWIHQTYARTFARYGEWAYRPGVPSSGSTAPLWTLLLAVGYWLPVPPTWWAYLLGIGAGAALVLVGGRLSYALFGNHAVAGWTMAALAVEWHLLWAAVSGMEIALYAALALLLLWLFIERRGAPWLWGIAGGLLTLTRPEGLWLVGLVGLAWLLEQRHEPRRAIGGGAQMALGWAAVVAPAVYFNWLLSGLPFPNTFYAKQQEYGELMALPLWQRLQSVLTQPWLGGQTFLIPALPFLRWRTLPARGWLPLLWAAGLVAVYALRLPVTYQHGRYLMPVIPVFLLYGIAALRDGLVRLPAIWRRPLGVSAGAAFALFVLLGANSYSADVTVIECEMGGAAAWIESNSASNELLAIHDIGKVGYMTPNPLLDFAGLISPETIPILRQEQALLALAGERNAAYLVTFADWYPTMVQHPSLQVRYATDCPVTAAAGQAPMTIYELIESP